MLRFITGLLAIYLPLEAVISIKPVDVGEKSGFFGEVAFAYSSNRGNTMIDQFDTGVLLGYDTRTTASFLRADYSYGEANDVKTIQKAFAHARHIRNILSNTDWELFAQEQTDLFQKLISRTLLGTGGRFSVGDPFLSGRGYLGVGIMQVREEEQLTLAIFFTRYNLYLSYKLLPTEAISVALELYYQPNIVDFSDYLVSSTAQAKIALHKKLSLIITLSYQVNSQPAAGVNSQEFAQKTAINYSF